MIEIDVSLNFAVVFTILRVVESTYNWHFRIYKDTIIIKCLSMITKILKATCQ